MSRRLAIALVIQTMLVHAAWIGIRLMIGYRALDEGSSAAMLGIIAAAFAAPGAVLALPAGAASDRVGGPVLAMTGIVVITGGMSALLAGQGLWLLPVAAAVVGVGHVLVMVGQQTFVAHHSDARSRDGAFGTMTAAASVGQLVGPLAVTMVAALAGSGGHDISADAGIATSGALALCAVPATLLLIPSGRAGVARTRTRPEGFGFELLRTPGMARAIAVSAAILVTIDLLYTFVPAWAAEHGVSATTVGWLLALRAAVSIVSRIGLSRLVQRYGRLHLLRLSITLGAVALAVLPFTGAVGAIPVMVLLGVALGVPQPLTMAWVISLVPDGVHGQALGLRLSANRFAQICLPALVGVAAGPYGVVAVFLANAVFLAGSLVALRPADASD